MKFKCNFVKVFAGFLLVYSVLTFTTVLLDKSARFDELVANDRSVFSRPQMNTPALNVTDNLLGYLFQVMFILFFISPPIIAFMLFLIWKELKERNRLK